VALHCSGVLADNEAVLRAVPAPSGDAVARLAAASRLAEERRMPLDRAALAAERAALLP